MKWFTPTLTVIFTKHLLHHTISFPGRENKYYCSLEDILTFNLHFSQNKQRILPDIVATTKDVPPDVQRHSKRVDSDSDHTEERLKAIFQLHSMKLSEQTKTRRNSDPDKACLTRDLFPCDAAESANTKRSSMSSDSSSTKYEDVKYKKLEQKVKKKVRIDDSDHEESKHSKRSSSKDNHNIIRDHHHHGRSSRERDKSQEGQTRLTSSDVAHALLQHRSSHNNNNNSSGSSSLPSTPQSLRRSSHGGSLSSNIIISNSLNNSLSYLGDDGGQGGGGYQERRGSKGIIKPSAPRPVFTSDSDHLHAKVGYSNYQFHDSSSRPGFVFLGSSGHVIAECTGHPSNNKIIVKTVRDSMDDDDERGDKREVSLEEEFDEDKIYAAQILRTSVLIFERLKSCSQ